jgi:bifunctional non-homologous end joining protein LigD
MGPMASDDGESPRLTNLDQPLFDGSGSTKRDLLDYLDALADRLVPALADRPLSVVRVLRGQDPFMQKNLPRYTPDWVRSVTVWAASSRRDVRYALCDDRRTLLWLGNQRSVEYHPTLSTAAHPDRPTHLVMDLDPPEGAGFAVAVAAARLVREVLTGAGLTGVVKTSGAKGLHVFVPLRDTAPDDAFAASRAIAVRAAALDPDLATTEFIREDRGGRVFLDSTRAGGATVVSVYSPRVRPGAPVSFPLDWADLDDVTPADFTLHTAAERLAGRDPWAERMPPPVELDADLVAEGHAIPVPRVAAMHEGRRRARARRS